MKWILLIFVFLSFFAVGICSSPCYVFMELSKIPSVLLMRAKITMKLTNKYSLKERSTNEEKLLSTSQSWNSSVQKIFFQAGAKMLLSCVSPQLIISYNHFLAWWSKISRPQRSLSFTKIESNCTEIGNSFFVICIDQYITTKLKY